MLPDLPACVSFLQMGTCYNAWRQTALQRGTTARLDSSYPTDYSSAVAYFVLEKDMDQYPQSFKRLRI